MGFHSLPPHLGSTCVILTAHSFFTRLLGQHSVHSSSSLVSLPNPPINFLIDTFRTSHVILNSSLEWLDLSWAWKHLEFDFRTPHHPALVTRRTRRCGCDRTKEDTSSRSLRRPLIFRLTGPPISRRNDLSRLQHLLWIRIPRFADQSAERIQVDVEQCAISNRIQIDGGFLQPGVEKSRRRSQIGPEASHLFA